MTTIKKLVILGLAVFTLSIALGSAAGAQQAEKLPLSLKSTIEVLNQRGDIDTVYYLINISERPINISKIVFNGHCEVGGPNNKWPFRGLNGYLLGFQGTEQPNLNLPKTGDNFKFTAKLISHICGGIQIVYMDAEVDDGTIRFPFN